MAQKKDRTREELRRDEKRIGENLPDDFRGVEGADVGDVDRGKDKERKSGTAKR